MFFFIVDKFLIECISSLVNDRVGYVTGVGAGRCQRCRRGHGAKQDCPHRGESSPSKTSSRTSSKTPHPRLPQPASSAFSYPPAHGAALSQHAALRQLPAGYRGILRARGCCSCSCGMQGVRQGRQACGRDTPCSTEPRSQVRGPGGPLQVGVVQCRSAMQPAVAGPRGQM